MSVQIVIVNQSSAVNATQAQAIAMAIQAYLQQDVAPAWAKALNLDPAGVTVTCADAAAGGAWPLALVDQDPTPDALGYHEDEGSPSAIVNVGEIIQYGGFVLTGSGPGSPSVSSVVAHEAAEMLVDPEADDWVSLPDGRSTIKEVCDWVQAMSYPKKLGDGSSVDVSNFVLPAGFAIPAVAGAALAAPYDFLGALTNTFELAPGGYMSVQAADGSVSQVNGDRPVGHVPKIKLGDELVALTYWERRRAKKWSRASKVARPRNS